MNTLAKGAHSMRIIALPLARVNFSPEVKLKPCDRNMNTLLVFYHFDLISPCTLPAGRKELPWHKKVLRNATNKAVDFWTSLGKTPKDSRRLWTYELGERMADRIEFEEQALRSVDPSLGPTVSTGTGTKGVDDIRNDWNQTHSLPKIPLIYPPSLYPIGANHALHPTLAHLQTLVASRAPRHRRGVCLWMLAAPFTVPITLIPIIPNLPLFFCVWRTWSHYRAYRSSQYLSSLLDCDFIEPTPSFELDKLYTSFASSSKVSPNYRPPTLAPKPSEETSVFGDTVTDRISKAASGMGPSQSKFILLTSEGVSQILNMFRLPESTATDIRHAIKQAHVRIKST